MVLNFSFKSMNSTDVSCFLYIKHTIGVQSISNNHFAIILSIYLLHCVFILGGRAASWVGGVLIHIMNKPLGKICWVNLQATIELVRTFSLEHLIIVMN
jgi:hypothetical protein